MVIECLEKVTLMQEVDGSIVFHKLCTSGHVHTGIVGEGSVLEQVILPVDIGIAVPLLGIERVAVLLDNAHRHHVGPSVIAGHHELALDGTVAHQVGII